MESREVESSISRKNCFFPLISLLQLIQSGQNVLDTFEKAAFFIICIRCENYIVKQFQTPSVLKAFLSSFWERIAFVLGLWKAKVVDKELNPIGQGL